MSAVTTTSTWQVKRIRASRRRMSFTSPKLTVLLLPTTRVIRTRAPENMP